MYARQASRFSMRACGGSVLASEAGWFAAAGADRVSTCITSGADLAHDQSPQRLATNKLTRALPDSFNFDPSLAHLIRDSWVLPKPAARLSAPSELSGIRTVTGAVDAISNPRQSAESEARGGMQFLEAG
jgi:hypothetical protein